MTKGTIPKALHFIGINGIGMSGLASIVLQKSVSRVTGSDLKIDSVGEGLRSKGAHLFLGHKKENLPQERATVVVSSGIAEDNPELVEAKARNMPLWHRSDLLIELMHGHQALLVTGTHGKTTTSALLSHVLTSAGEDPTCAVGGIMLNIDSNARCGKGRFFVAEADESDGTFNKYPYFGAIVTNIDTDHLSHFGTIEALEAAFAEFLKKAPSQERLFYCGDDPRLKKVCTKGISYGLQSTNDVRVENIQATEEGLFFDIRFRRKLFKEVFLPLYGEHNALNASAVFGLCLTLGLSETAIKEAFASFKGVKRRLERKEALPHCLVIDDYGHHPTEIAATLSAVCQATYLRRVVAVFQPHRPSRMRYCINELDRAFHQADSIVVTDLYHANEPVDPAVSTEKIVSVIKKSYPKIPSTYVPRASLVDGIIAMLRPNDVVVFFGAGDITKASDELALKLHEIELPKVRVGIVYGGMNAGHDLSVKSAGAIWKALDNRVYTPIGLKIDSKGHWKVTPGIENEEKGEQIGTVFSEDSFQALSSCDVCIPVLHDQFGNGGTIQGLFEMMQKPYVGSSVHGCSVCTDKATVRLIADASGIPVAPYMVLYAKDWHGHRATILAEIAKKLRQPIRVCSARAPVGTERFSSDKSPEVQQAIDTAISQDSRVVIEQVIEGRTIAFALLGNDCVLVSPPGEIVDAEALMRGKACKALASVNLKKEDLEQGGVLAKKAYQALSCNGLAIMCFLVDAAGHWFFKEAFPFPGFTDECLYPKVFEDIGVSREDLVHKLIILAFAKHRKQQKALDFV